MINTIKTGSIFEHYKGRKYKVLNIAYFSEDPEMLMVVYEALYDDIKFGNNAIWARPLNMFLEQIEVDGKITPRFKEVL